MKKSIRNRIAAFFLTFLLLPVCLQSASAAGDVPAEEMTRFLRIEQGRHPGSAEKLVDDYLDESFRYAPFEVVRLTWPDAPRTPTYLCIQWGTVPKNVHIRQTDASGNLIDDESVGTDWDSIIPLFEETTGVTVIAGEEGMDLIRIALFTEGKLPEPFLPWQETPRGMDYLVIATHPDDDVLFMGAVVPIYGAEQGYTGTVAFVTNPSRRRVDEAKLGAWAMGTTYHPLFLGFMDISEYARDVYPYCFLSESVTLALVRMLREYRPLVVFSHDLNGEYGHWQHKVVAASVSDAVRLCADPSYDPASYEQFGTWEVKKCYLHLYAENTLEMDIQSPLFSMGGRSALSVARGAFLKHKSQQSGRYHVQAESEPYAMNKFGMIYGTVDAGNDVFDNIDPSLLSTYTQPLAEPVPPAEPTPEPTEEPMLQPVAEATPAVTPQPAVTVIPDEPKAEEPIPAAQKILLPVLCALGGAAAASVLFVLFGRRKRR